MNDLGHRQFDKKFSQREHTVDQLETAIRCLACVVAVALALALMGVFSYGCAPRRPAPAVSPCRWTCECPAPGPTIARMGPCEMAAYEQWCHAFCQR